MEELLRLALCGQNVSITDAQLVEAFERSFDQEPSICCAAELQAWCDAYDLQLSYNPDQALYNISKND